MEGTGSSSASGSPPGSPNANKQLKSLVKRLDESSAAKLLELARGIGVAPVSSPTVQQELLRAQRIARARARRARALEPTIKEGPFVFKSANEIYNLPMVQSFVGTTNKCYTSIKKSNCLCNLYLTGLEKAVNGVSMATRPVSQCLLYTPVGIMDAIAYKGITFIEKQVPVLTLPTDQVIDDAKEYIEITTRSCRKSIKKYVGGAIMALLPEDKVIIIPARPGNEAGNSVPRIAQPNGNEARNVTNGDNIAPEDVDDNEPEIDEFVNREREIEEKNKYL